MMKYTPLHKDWYYSYVDIPNLDNIKEEIIRLIKTSNQKYEVNLIYSNYTRKTVFKNCPHLKEYLCRIELDKKFNRMLVSKDLSLEKKQKVHVDTYDPNITTHSLNIGLLDYKESYTAWYKTNKVKLRESSEFGLNPITNYAYLFVEEAEEINRVEYDNRPILVNTTILHKGISDKKTRLICGLRFSPELTEEDIKRMGIKNPHIQEQ
jgi:hypothetical protein